MKYIQKPSLEHMALVKVVAMLWRQKDIRDLISDFPDSTVTKWLSIENRVVERINQLSVPRIVKEKMISFVKPMGLQIFNWMQFLHSDGLFHMDLLGVLCWTPQGTINRKKTVEILIKVENLDIIKRYELACIYCLEKDIPELWNKIPKLQRDFLLLENYSSVSEYLIKCYWPHVLQVGHDNLLYFDQDMFKYCAMEHNNSATKYFLQKLTSVKRKESLVSAVMYVQDGELLCFLLSQMNEEQEKEVFKKYPYKVLLLLLDWPLQSFFINVGDCIWEFLNKVDFDHLLKTMVNKIKDGYKDCNYGKLFEIFWQRSPSDHKSYVIDQYHQGYLVPYLFQIKDKDKMKFIFQDATRAEKQKCIYFYLKKTFSHYFVSEEKWDFLRFLIQEWLPSETERIKIKEELERNIGENEIQKVDFEKNKRKWNQLFFSV